MPEEDIAIPGVGRRLLIFIVTLLLLYCNPHCSVTAHHAIDPIGHAVIERIGKYAFGFVAINLRKMCSFLKRSVYL